MVIDELLVKLGLQTEKKDFQEAGSLFMGLRSQALQFGAVLAGGMGFKELTLGFAGQKDALGKFANQMGTTAQFVDALGQALEHSGGQASDAFSSIARMRDLLKDIQYGNFPAQALIEGFDPTTLAGVTGLADAYERIADATAGMTPEKQRRIYQALGFGSTADFNLLSQSRAPIQELMKRAEELAPVTDEMTKTAADFNDALQDMKKSITGVSDAISVNLLPLITEQLKGATGYISENRDDIAKWFEKALPYLEITAKGIAALVALQVGKSGVDLLRGKGGLVKQLGVAGIAAGIGSKFIADQLRSIFGESYNQLDYKVTDFLTNIGSEKTVNSPSAPIPAPLSAAGAYSVPTAPGQSLADAYGARGRAMVQQNNTFNINGGNTEEVKRVVGEEINRMTQNTIEDTATGAK